MEQGRNRAERRSKIKAMRFYNGIPYLIFAALAAGYLAGVPSASATSAIAQANHATVTVVKREELFLPLSAGLIGRTNASMASNKMPKFTYSGTCSLVDQGDGNWIIRFITSGTLVLKSNTSIDVFILGGGAGGHPAIISGSTYCGGGGGSGFTLTLLNVYAFGETSYSIIVGAGGAISSAGNSSSAFGYTANGGGVNSNHSWGGNGQSGGGGGGIAQTNNAGGTNGSNGSGAYPGNGNGQTTREFGESSGVLYASGGIGGGSGSSAAANTGNGGDGHATNTSVAGVGGSGIVAIRNHRAA